MSFSYLKSFYKPDHFVLKCNGLHLPDASVFVRISFFDFEDTRRCLSARSVVQLIKSFFAVNLENLMKNSFFCYSCCCVTFATRFKNNAFLYEFCATFRNLVGKGS